MSKQPTLTAQLAALQAKYDTLAETVTDTVSYAYQEDFHVELCDTGKKMLNRLATLVNADAMTDPDGYECYVSDTSFIPASAVTKLQEGMEVTPRELAELVGDNLKLWIQLT